MKRLIALFLATVQFRSIAAIGYARPAYNPYTGAGAPPPPALTPAQRAAQRDPNLLAARPLQRSAAPKPTHALYMQINLGQSAEDVPTADYNGIEGLQLMNASAAADLFTLAGVYGTTAAQHLSAPSRYTIKPSVPRGSEAEKYLAGLPVIQADSAGRYLVPGERERERAPVVPSDNLAVRAYYLGSCCRRSRRRYVLVSQVPPLPPLSRVRSRHCLHAGTTRTGESTPFTSTATLSTLWLPTRTRAAPSSGMRLIFSAATSSRSTRKAGPRPFSSRITRLLSWCIATSVSVARDSLGCTPLVTRQPHYPHPRQIGICVLVS